MKNQILSPCHFLEFLYLIPLYKLLDYWFAAHQVIVLVGYPPPSTGPCTVLKERLVPSPYVSVITPHRTPFFLPDSTRELKRVGTSQSPLVRVHKV